MLNTHNAQTRANINYLRELPSRKQEQYFLMDMYRDYLSIEKILLPNATIVIDRFHVVRYCVWAVEKVRKNFQKKLFPEQREYFKCSRKLLPSHMEDPNDESMAAVERILLTSRELRVAYSRKETFYAFMRSTDSMQVKECFREFRLLAYVAQLAAFESFLCSTPNIDGEPLIYCSIPNIDGEPLFYPNEKSTLAGALSE